MVCRVEGRSGGKALVCLCVLGFVTVGYGQTDFVSQQIEMLKAKDVAVRIQAAKALGEARNPSAVTPLIAALWDLDRYSRTDFLDAAVDALGKIGAPAVEPLIAASKKPCVYGFSHLYEFRALGKIGGPAVEPLIAAIGSPSSGLDRRGPPRARPAFRASRSSGLDRRLAAYALGEIKDPRSAEFLMGALRARDYEVIAGAYAFFIARGDPDSESAFIEAIDKFGNAQMAQDLLNCGNSKLEADAQWWAKRHGYRIQSTPGGGGGLRWGGSR